MLDALVDRVERADVLDRAADLLAAAAKPLTGPPARDLLSGTAAAHPLHPALVAMPIGAWTTASALDVLREPGAARKAVGLGLLAALPTLATGLHDWADTVGAERRVGLVHALVNDVAVGAYAASWLARRRGRNVKGAALAATGAAVLTVGGWLGGHLAYARGVGVDTNAFTSGPDEWTDVLGEAELPAVGGTVRVDAAGVPVLIIVTAAGPHGLADRCTHRGGPLSEGSLEDGCIVCPWHGSAFDIEDGSVARGPASRPQPRFQVRVRDGRVQVRRDDTPAGLRTVPVGP